MSTPVMDIVGGEHCDTAMSMLGVVPGEERAAKGGGGGEVVEASGEVGVVLQRFELRLGEGVVVADVGAAQRAGDPEVGKELRGALAGHRRAAVGVQGEGLGGDVLFDTGVLDEPRGECGALALGDHPAHDVTAEEVDQDVEVEVRPALWPEQARDVPRPGLVRGGGHQLGLRQ